MRRWPPPDQTTANQYVRTTHVRLSDPGAVYLFDGDLDQYPPIGHHDGAVFGPVRVFAGRDAVVVHERLYRSPVWLRARTYQLRSALSGRPGSPVGACDVQRHA